jgi:hypothetical protein
MIPWGAQSLIVNYDANRVLSGVLKNKIILFLHRTLLAVLAIAAIDIPISSTATGKPVLKSDVCD